VRGSARLVAPIVRAILSIACRIDRSELGKVPRKGPLIIVTNHVNFLEAPLLYSFLYPRDISGFAKAETWRNPILGLLATIWECVPVERGANDISSMRRALEALARGKMLNVMPEGTRSHDGRLRRGLGGVVAMALRSGAPIVPIAHFGGEAFWRNLKMGRRTRVRIRVGEAFRLREPESGKARASRLEAAEEVMLRIAELLPREYRGEYAGRSATSRHLLPAGPLY
jgi:1-acyl-sn-glycerol-3-phosphate acyltransferase